MCYIEVEVSPPLCNTHILKEKRRERARAHAILMYRTSLSYKKHHKITSFFAYDTSFFHYLCSMKQKIATSIHLVILYICLLNSLFTQAQETTIQDSIRFSLLTCAPGEETYSLYGHTAIRYENPTRNIDAVFNYGMFSFNTPNFVLRFALGETDYQLGVYDYQIFATEYAYDKRDVWQQVLNLTQEEKIRLAQLLEENYQPKNRVYRYNFFYDNCATRPRDQIEKAINGTLQYAEDMAKKQIGKSYRDIVHECTRKHAWARFGADFCIGSKADEPISRRQMMFIPAYVKDFFEEAAIITPQGEKRPLVLATHKIVDTSYTEEKTERRNITPLQASLLLFILIVCCTIYGIRQQKTLWALDLVLFSAAGIASLVPTFLVLFSQHPAISPNYLLFVFHPFYLLCLPWIIICIKRRKRGLLLAINTLVLTFFILLWPIIPQRFDFAVLPLALSLLVRSANHLIFALKKKD